MGLTKLQNPCPMDFAQKSKYSRWYYETKHIIWDSHAKFILRVLGFCYVDLWRSKWIHCRPFTFSQSVVTKNVYRVFFLISLFNDQNVESRSSEESL